MKDLVYMKDRSTFWIGYLPGFWWMVETTSLTELIETKKLQQEIYQIKDVSEQKYYLLLLIGSLESPMFLSSPEW